MTCGRHRVSGAMPSGQAGPPRALVLIFGLAFFFSWRGRRAGILLLVIGTILVATMFLFDVATNDYQIQALTLDRGCRHFYATWWWYDSPQPWERRLHTIC